MRTMKNAAMFSEHWHLLESMDLAWMEVLHTAHLDAGNNSSDSNGTLLLASGHILTDLTTKTRSTDNAAAACVPRIKIAGGIPWPPIRKKKAKHLAATQAASAKNARQG